MTTQVLFFDAFSEKDPHLNAVEIFHEIKSIKKSNFIAFTSCDIG